MRFYEQINFILFYKSPQGSVDFLRNKWMTTLEKHLEGMRFYKKIFSILFYKSPQESVSTKNGCPPWNNTLKGSDFIKKYFLFYFTNAFAKISIPPLAGVEVRLLFFLNRYIK